MLVGGDSKRGARGAAVGRHLGNGAEPELTSTSSRRERNRLGRRRSAHAETSRRRVRRRGKPLRTADDASEERAKKSAALAIKGRAANGVRSTCGPSVSSGRDYRSLRGAYLNRRAIHELSRAVQDPELNHMGLEIFSKHFLRRERATFGPTIQLYS